MAPKKSPASTMGVKSPKSAPSDDKTSTYEEMETEVENRSVVITLMLHGKPIIKGDYNLLVLFDGQIIGEAKWEDELRLELEELPLDLREPFGQSLIADTPLIFLVRGIGGKTAKELEPLMHVDNRASANVDLYPLIVGQEEILVKVRLHAILTGEEFGCKITVLAKCTGGPPVESVEVPMILTMISAHCLPIAKEGTVYVGAVSMDGVLDPAAVNFGMSLSERTAKKIMWAKASIGGPIANTAYNVPNEDKFIPVDLEPNDTLRCNSVYWNAMKRVLVDPNLLRDRLSSPFLVEVAGVPRFGKVDVRGRYMAFVDAAVLLEPDQFSVTTCAKLKVYSDLELPENMLPVLELPPVSAKTSARDKGPTPSDFLMDEFGHTAYVVIRLDLMEPLVLKPKLAQLFDVIGFPPPEVPEMTLDELRVDPPPEDPVIDVRRIRKEEGALAVHRELSTLACRGAVPMNQSIKRTAANRLLIRVRTMLKQFAPDECSYLDWQDTVTGQHAAARRAVTASFAPQPHPLRLGTLVAAARSRMAGDERIADKHATRDLKVAGKHPRILLSKTLRCLEERNDREAKTFILKALKTQAKNRFLLWSYGGQEYNKGEERMKAAKAAIRISVRGEHSDGIANAIGWAALHALYHHDKEVHAAFVAAKKMRKSYELGMDWKEFLERWTSTSGEEEVFWMPATVSSHSPMLIAAAFFLCLRCYDFTERLLRCYEEGCGTRGSRLGLITKLCPDVYYLRAASWLLRRQIDNASEITEAGIKKFGPCATLLQMRATCLACAGGWDGETEAAFVGSERAGAEPCPHLLLQAASAGLKTNPIIALQRAGRAHKIAPSAHSALLIARVYEKLGERPLAVRWASSAVRFEPLLADGWAFLALIAIRERNVHRARTMLRTAREVGPLSADIEKQLDEMMKIVKVEALPEEMVKNLCLCDYY